MTSDLAQVVLIIEPHNQLAQCMENISRNSHFLRPAKLNEQPTLEFGSGSSREATPYADVEMPTWELRLDKPPFCGGQWVFGRSADPQECDFQLADNPSSGVSNQQFKIHHNSESGALLISNLSRRGTKVKFGEEFEVLRDSRTMPHGPLPVRTGALQFELKIPHRSKEIKIQHEEYRQQFISITQTRDPHLVGASSGITSINPTPAAIPLEKGYIDIIQDEELGYSSFSTVRLGIHRYTGQVYAVKRINVKQLHKYRSNADKMIANEIALVKKVSHENIVEFHQVSIELDWVTIIMKYVKLGDLTKPHHGQFTYEEVYTIAKQQCSAIAYLHSMEVTHRDIKPGNILLESREPIVTKLADFGESSLSPLLKTYSGTEVYRAPELMYKEENDTYTDKVDVWSLGLVLVQLLEPTVPVQSLYMIPEKRQGTLAKLCQSMLVVDPLKRATAQKCVDLIQTHPIASWINEESSSNEVKASKPEKRRSVHAGPSVQRKKSRAK